MHARPGLSRHVELTMLVGASVCLLGVRLLATSRVGFGDSEALYATYALHPQPGYLDHPGLVGVLARTIGGGTAPGPERTHAVTSVLSTLVPWTMALACRASGASWPRSFVAALIFALVPEVAIGLFAMTPDLLLAFAWTAGLAFAADGLRSTPGSARAAGGLAAAGVLGGIAAASKLSGVTLLVALAVTYASRAARPHARTIAPWAGLAAGSLVVTPIALFEARNGWPMLHHRLVDTQSASGLSLRNLGALLGGQLAYLSPFMAVLAALAARELWRGRGDPTGMLLFACCLVPLAALLPLCLWSRVAEPHWLAPALLALVPGAARSPERAPTQAPTLLPTHLPRWPRWLVACSCALSGALVAAAHAWVLVPSLLRLAPPSYDPRLDLANELYGWADALHVVREEAGRVGTAPTDQKRRVVVVGPHWVICAQLAAGLRGELPVGCNTPVRDDFDDWLPRDVWRAADVIVWVTDDRFRYSLDVPTHATVRTRVVPIERSGRVVRRFTITLLGRRVMALAAPPLDTGPFTLGQRPRATVGGEI